MRWQDETPIHNLIAEGAQIDNAFLTVARIGDDRKEGQIGSQPINDAEDARDWLDRTADAALGDADEARLRVRLWRADRTMVRSVQTRVWPDAGEFIAAFDPGTIATSSGGSNHGDANRVAEVHDRPGMNHSWCPNGEAIGHGSDESPDETDEQDEEGDEQVLRDENENDENDPENAWKNAENGNQGRVARDHRDDRLVARSPPGRLATTKPAPRRTAPPTTTLTVRRAAPVATRPANATRPQTSTRPPVRVQARHAHVAPRQYAPMYAPPCPTCTAATTTTALLQSRVSELSAMLAAASTAVRDATRRAEDAELAARSRGRRAKDAEAEVARLRAQNTELSQEVRRLRIEEKRLDAQVADFYNGVVDQRNSMAEFDD